MRTESPAHAQSARRPQLRGGESPAPYPQRRSRSDLLVPIPSANKVPEKKSQSFLKEQKRARAGRRPCRGSGAPGGGDGGYTATRRSGRAGRRAAGGAGTVSSGSRPGWLAALIALDRVWLRRTRPSPRPGMCPPGAGRVLAGASRPGAPPRPGRRARTSSVGPGSPRQAVGATPGAPSPPRAPASLGWPSGGEMQRGGGDGALGVGWGWRGKGPSPTLASRPRPRRRAPSLPAAPPSPGIARVLLEYE